MDRSHFLAGSQTCHTDRVAPKVGLTLPPILGLMLPLPRTQGLMLPLPRMQGLMLPLPRTQGLMPPLPRTQGLMLPLPRTQGLMPPLPRTQGLMPPLPRTQGLMLPLPRTQGLMRPRHLRQPRHLLAALASEAAAPQNTPQCANARKTWAAGAHYFLATIVHFGCVER